MRKKDFVSRRMDFIVLMRKKKISVETRMSFMTHLAYFENQEEGNIILDKSWEMLENGATEKEFVEFLQTEYGLKHVLDMKQEEHDIIQDKINQGIAKMRKEQTIDWGEKE